MRRILGKALGVIGTALFFVLSGIVSMPFTAQGWVMALVLGGIIIWLTE